MDEQNSSKESLFKKPSFKLGALVVIILAASAIYLFAMKKDSQLSAPDIKAENPSVSSSPENSNSADENPAGSQDGKGAEKQSQVEASTKPVDLDSELKDLDEQVNSIDLKDLDQSEVSSTELGL